MDELGLSSLWLLLFTVLLKQSSVLYILIESFLTHDPLCISFNMLNFGLLNTCSSYTAKYVLGENRFLKLYCLVRNIRLTKEE